MDKMINLCELRKYEFDFGKGIYKKIAESDKLKKIHGDVGDSILVRGSSRSLILIEKIEQGYNKGKEIIKVHSKEPEIMQSKLEKITGVGFSKYRTY